MNQDPVRGPQSAGCHAEVDTGMRKPQGQPPAAQPLVIDPQELTLGALIGEGGFGKVLLNQPSICISPPLSCCQCPPGLVSRSVNACGEMYCLTYTFCHACPS